MGLVISQSPPPSVLLKECVVNIMKKLYKINPWLAYHVIYYDQHTVIGYFWRYRQMLEEMCKPVRSIIIYKQLSQKYYCFVHVQNDVISFQDEPTYEFAFEFDRILCKHFIEKQFEYIQGTTEQKMLCEDHEIIYEILDIHCVKNQYNYTVYETKLKIIKG